MNSTSMAPNLNSDIAPDKQQEGGARKVS